jgi:hypothetical protein
MTTLVAAKRAGWYGKLVSAGSHGRGAVGLGRVADDFDLDASQALPGIVKAVAVPIVVYDAQHLRQIALPAGKVLRDD